MRVLVVALVLLAAVAACGAEQPSATIPTTPTSSTTSTSRAENATTETPASPTTSTSVVQETTTTVPQADVEFRDGEVNGPDVVRVDLGDEVDVWVLSDVDDQMHVHGYDLYHDLVAGELFHLTFVADVPGLFEVEVHTGHTLLFNLEVSG